MKKIIAIILALMLIASLSMTAFAEEQKGSITINGIGEATTYKVYKLLDLSYSPTDNAYSYRTNTKWNAFFGTTEAKKYMTIDKDGFATWSTTEDAETKANFAKLALQYAKDNNIQPEATSKETAKFQKTGNIGKFLNLELGYYLVDSNMGVLCGLTTTNYDASINAKNAIPTVDKQVLEDSTNQWGISNSADINQEVEFRVTINVHPGAQNYVLHDVMDTGLTFMGITGIQHVIPGTEDSHPVAAARYVLKTHKDVVTDAEHEIDKCSCEDGKVCAFEIHFDEVFAAELETNNKIIVTYKAKLNEAATIAGEGNKNTAWLTFGEVEPGDTPHKSNEDSVTTFTYFIDLIKTDPSNKLLDGSTFRIYGSLEGSDEIAVEKVGSGYRRVHGETTGADIVVTGGNVRITGLDNGTYYLEELDAPDGYNQLTARQKFIVSDGNLEAVFNDSVYSTGSGVQVVNKTGIMLPETGGLGTLLFTLLGGGAALGTGVVLVTKKRMSKIDDED